MKRRSARSGAVVVLCNPVSCPAMSCCEVRCGAVRCGAVPCGAVPCGAVPCRAVTPTTPAGRTPSPYCVVLPAPYVPPVGTVLRWPTTTVQGPRSPIVGLAPATLVALRRCSAMCAGVAGLGALHGTAPGIPTGGGPFPGRCRIAGTVRTAVSSSVRSARLAPSWWGGCTSDGPLSAAVGHW